MRVIFGMLTSMKYDTSFFKNSTKDQGYFISFEGLEGCGKSTQAIATQQWLQQQDYLTTLYREPGATLFGEELRAVILKQKNPIHPLAEAHLFCAARTQLLSEKLLPMLNNCKSVILCDRYIDSTLAYQGHARGLGFQCIIDMHRTAPLNLIPDRTYYLKLDIETSYQRQATRGQTKDYFEAEEKEFHEKLSEGFDLLAAIFPQRIKIIDATLPVVDITNLIVRDLQTMVMKKE